VRRWSKRQDLCKLNNNVIIQQYLCLHQTSTFAQRAVHAV
jgi:hypothetical protein